MLLMYNNVGVQSIGVYYGMLGNNLPSPREVVDFYLLQIIGRMRLHGENWVVFYALRGSNIELLLGVPNEVLQKMAHNPSAGESWVQNNVRNYWPDVKFRYMLWAMRSFLFP